MFFLLVLLAAASAAYLPTNITANTSANCSRGNTTCIIEHVQVSQNTKLLLAESANQTMATVTFLELLQHNYVLLARVNDGPNTVAGTFRIYGKICFPLHAQAAKRVQTLQFLAHGDTLDQTYIAAAVAAGYAIAEIRLEAEYGDYLAYACANLNTESMNNLAWKIDRLDWQEVAERIEKAEATKAEQEARRIALSPNPYLDDIAKAAARLGYDFDLVRYQILAYTDHNNFCHSGLKAMIELGHSQELAERLVEDKTALGVISQGKPHDQIQMRTMIKTIEKEWFEKIYMEEASKRRQYRFQDLKARVRFSLTDKGVEKMRKMARAH